MYIRRHKRSCTNMCEDIVHMCFLKDSLCVCVCVYGRWIDWKCGKYMVAAVWLLFHSCFPFIFSSISSSDTFQQVQVKVVCWCRCCCCGMLLPHVIRVVKRCCIDQMMLWTTLLIEVADRLCWIFPLVRLYKYIYISVCMCVCEVQCAVEFI